MVFNFFRKYLFLISLVFINIIFAQQPERILSFPDGTRYEPGESEIFTVYSKKDGKYSVDYKIDLNDKDTIIVQFSQKPLCITDKNSVLSKQSQINNEHQEFKNILNNIVLSKSTTNYNTNYKIKNEYYKVFNGITIECSQGLTRKIKTFPMVKRVYEDAKVKATLFNSIKQIKADIVQQELGYTGKGVLIGIVDTGIDYTHPAFGNGFGTGSKVVGGYDFVNNDNDPIDDEGHGTHVAGIVAGKCDSITGVAPDANLLAVKVLDSYGHGSTSDIISGIEYCFDPDNDISTDDGVDIINMSLGAGRTTPNPMDSVVNNISTAGILVVAAAGNIGYDYSSIRSPGTAKEALTVGACDSDFDIPRFSSKGLDPIYDRIKPEVVAPGVDIYSSIPNGSYEYNSGTSMAAPHVAGVAALIKEKYPDFTPSEIKSLIVNNAQSLPNEELFSAGNGCVDALKAIEDSLIIDPGTISFGFADSRLNEWQDTAYITIKNNFDTEQRVKLSVNNNSQAQYSVILSEDDFIITPGDQKEVEIKIQVPGTVPVLNEPPYAYTGQIECKTSTDTTTIPYSFVKSPMLIVNFDREPEFMDMINLDTDENHWWFSFDNYVVKTRIPKGNYAFICQMREEDTSKTYIVGKENLTVSDYNEYNITYQDAKYKVKNDLFDHNDNLLTTKNYYGWIELSFKHILGTTGDVDYISNLDTNWTYSTQFCKDTLDYYIGILHASKGIQKQSDLTIKSGSKHIKAYQLQITLPNKNKFQKNLAGLWLYGPSVGSWSPFINNPYKKTLYLRESKNNYSTDNQYFQIMTEQIIDSTKSSWDYPNADIFYSPQMRFSNINNLESYFVLYNSYGKYKNDYDYRYPIIKTYRQNDIIKFTPKNEILFPLLSQISRRVEFAGYYTRTTPSGVIERPRDQKNFFNYFLYSNTTCWENQDFVIHYENGSGYMPYLTFDNSNGFPRNTLRKLVGISPQYSIQNQKGISITEINYIEEFPEDGVIDIPVLQSFQLLSDDNIVNYIIPKKNNIISFGLYDDKDNIKEVSLSLITSDGKERYLQVMEIDNKYYTRIPSDLPKEFIDCRISVLDSNNYSNNFTASPAFYNGSSIVENFEGRLHLMQYKFMDINKKKREGYNPTYPIKTGDTLIFNLKYQNIGNVSCENIHWNFPWNYFFKPLYNELTLDKSIEPGDSCLIDLKLIALRDESDDTTFAYYPEIKWFNGEKEFFRKHSIFNTYIKYDSQKYPAETVCYEYRLDNNYPNPFNMQTTIPFEIPEQAKVKIQIYNILGQLIRTVTNEEFSVGYHTVKWDGTDDIGKQVCSGIYFYQFETNTGKLKHAKMILLK